MDFNLSLLQQKDHIKPRCYHYLADLRRVKQDRTRPQRKVKQVWVKKLDSCCNMSCTSLNIVEEIGNNKKTFHEKHVANVLGELEHSSHDVFDRIGAGGSDEAKMKSNIPPCLAFICLLLIKKGE